MMKIKVNGIIAINKNGYWLCSDSAIKARLNEKAPQEDIPACEPNKEWYQVTQARDLLDATILSLPPKIPRLRTYKVF